MKRQEIYLLLAAAPLMLKIFNLPWVAGSGIMSQNSVFRGFFNAAIKLPCGVNGNSAGIVSAFYVSVDSLQNAFVRSGTPNKASVSICSSQTYKWWCLSTILWEVVQKISADITESFKFYQDISWVTHVVYELRLFFGQSRHSVAMVGCSSAS